MSPRWSSLRNQDQATRRYLLRASSQQFSRSGSVGGGGQLALKRAVDSEICPYDGTCGHFKPFFLQMLKTFLKIWSCGMLAKFTYFHGSQIPRESTIF